MRILLNKALKYTTLVLLLNSTSYGWDRYSNETESIIGTGVSATNIMRYQFTVTATKAYDIYTDEASSGGDTYMNLWDENGKRQVAKNDDASVPSGNIWCSRIKATLNPGTYIVFVRAWSEAYPGTASLFVNGTRVLANTKFRGSKVTAIPTDLRKGDRLRTKNLSPSTGDTYCLLTTSGFDVVGYNDNGGDPANYRASSVTVPSSGQWAVIVGSYSASNECTCDLALTRDYNLGFISLAGPEQRHVDGASEFTRDFSSGYALCHNPGYTTCYAATSWEFTSQRLSSTDAGIDNVDLMYIFTHGAPRLVEMRDGTGLVITGAVASCGVNDRTDNTFGTLEFMAIFSCQTVRIEHTQSFDWLVNSGWKSSATQKGLFEGLHEVVGYHSDYTNNHPALSENSEIYEARDFSNKLRGGQSVWDAFWQTNSESATKYSNWFFTFKPGTASSISIVSQKDQKLADFRTDDVTYGNSAYLFNIRWYGSGGAPPN
jgi:hypothetical protein